MNNMNNMNKREYEHILPEEVEVLMCIARRTPRAWGEQIKKRFNSLLRRVYRCEEGIVRVGCPHCGVFGKSVRGSVRCPFVQRQVGEFCRGACLVTRFGGICAVDTQCIELYYGGIRFCSPKGCSVELGSPVCLQALVKVEEYALAHVEWADMIGEVGIKDDDAKQES